MKTLNWTLLHLLLITAGGLIVGINGKCTQAPLQHDRTIAYVCVNSNLVDVEDIPSEAEWIEFTVSRINYLPADAFSRFHNLRRLTFYNCDLRQLSNEAFRGLNNLEWLVMSNTKIAAARAAQFRYLTNLRRLTLDGAGLVYIEPEVFHCFSKLETLSLRDNDLDCLPIEALGVLRNLKTVQIGKNPWLCDCRTSLDKFFKRHMIQHGPADEDCIVRNHTRGDWTRRGVYDCMTTLEYPELPHAGSQGGSTTLVPHSRGRFEWREITTTEITSLEKLPDEIVWIQIFDVAIPIIGHYAFFRFGNTLRSIEMKNCGIEIIERESFAGLHKLERLSLVGNRFATLGHEWFRDLARLTILDLRNNEIVRFAENALIHLGALRQLDISGNRLRCMPQDYIHGLLSLQKLIATENPWSCECKDHLENYLTRMRIGYEISSGRCLLPGQATTWESERYNQSSWTSSTTSVTGKIRWSWAYEVHRPGTPVIIRPTTMNIPPPVVVSSTQRPLTRPGGCHLVHQAGPGQYERRIKSCLCTRASLIDLVDVPDTVDSIVYSGSIIPTIHNDAFRQFGRYLRRLEFHECGIQVIENRAFYNLRVLETLVIRGNDLDQIKSEWFEDMRNLRRLDIARNGIMRISNGVFDRVPYLTALDISDNRLNCIGIDHIEALRYLRELEISGNPWTCLCIRKLVELMKDRAITCKCNPEALIRTNEGGWGCNGHETGVTLSFPTTTPPTTTTTTTTTTTAPYIPSIMDIPTTGQPSGSCYQSYENVLGGGGPWYHCANGDITLLRKIPHYITKIEIIDSYIPRLNAMVFSRFENLTELILRNCTLRDADPRAFAGLRKLEKLTIRNNRISIVSNGWFRDTKNLVRLDMSDNYLMEIENGAFDGLDRLEYLNLENNAFKCIYTNCFVGLPRLATLEFGRNPLKWRCWQELRQFLEIRAIGYTYHKCPHDGKDLVRNLLKDDSSQQSGVNNSGSTLFVNFPAIMIIFIISGIKGLCFAQT